MKIRILFFWAMLVMMLAASAFAETPVRGVERFLSDAVTAVKAEDWQEAADAFEAAQATGEPLPESFGYHFGRTLVRLKRYAEARTVLEKYREKAGGEAPFFSAAGEMLDRIQPILSQELQKTAKAQSDAREAELKALKMRAEPLFIFHSYEAARKLLQTAAEADDARSQIRLGWMNAKGLGGETDLKTAENWFERVVGRGDPDVVGRIGTLFIKANGGEPDYEQGLLWLRRAADMGSAEAMLSLGRTAQAKPAGAAEALQWFQKAADAGMAVALTEMGRMYLLGNQIGKNYAEAFRLLQLAEERGDPPASWYLAVMYSQGQGVPQDHDMSGRLIQKAADKGFTHAQKYLAARARQDAMLYPSRAQEALEWYEKAFGLGDIDAAWHIGRIYEEGLGVMPKNTAAALKWYREAAELGNPGGMYHYGKMHEKGIGTEQNLDEAVLWYNRAVLRGAPAGMVALGRLYAAGKGVEKDPARAADLFRKAMDKNDTVGAYLLGIAYKDGEGVSRDPAEARRILQWAAERGHAKAGEILKALP